MNIDQNPYRWDLHNPSHQVARTLLLEEVQGRLARGMSGYLLGCRGMGKSVFLKQLEKELRQSAELQVFLIPSPGVKRSIPGAIQVLSEKMKRDCELRNIGPQIIAKLEEHADRGRLRELFDNYLATAPNDIERVVLLYDELDAYASFGGPFFDELEDIRKNSGARIVIFAAGGLGLAALDTLLGSSLFSRMDPGVLEPFDRGELKALAEPFSRRGSPLPSDVLDALLLASGGNLGLATFGLQHLWDINAPSTHDVTRLFAQFKTKHSLEFLNKIRDPIFESELSEAPALAWFDLQRANGVITQERLVEILKSAKGTASINKAAWVFRMLRSSGLIRCSDEDCQRSTVEVEIIPSILTFDAVEDSRIKGRSIREQLLADLSKVLASIHRMSADFYRSEERLPQTPETAKASNTNLSKSKAFKKHSPEKKILPESAFSVGICLGLEPRGWLVEREALSAAGRTDIKARHVDFGERFIVIEVKIWDRNDYQEIHAQVASYWSEGAEALATVTISDLQDKGWPAAFEEKCLTAKGLVFERKDVSSPLAGQFVAKTSSISVQEVDHMLLQLARRR